VRRPGLTRYAAVFNRNTSHNLAISRSPFLGTHRALLRGMHLRIPVRELGPTRYASLEQSFSIEDTDMVDRLVAILLGGFAFWIPVILFDRVSKGMFSIAAVNTFPVACAVCSYWLVRAQQWCRLRALPLYMLAGIYILGPLSMNIAASAFGGGFSRLWEKHDVLWTLVASCVPPVAMIMAGYNGTIFGLLAITIIMIVAAARARREPPEGASSPQ